MIKWNKFINNEIIQNSLFSDEYQIENLNNIRVNDIVLETYILDKIKESIIFQ